MLVLCRTRYSVASRLICDGHPLLLLLSSRRGRQLAAPGLDSSTHRTLTNDRSQIRGPYGAYLEEYKRSIENPQEFWADAAKQIDWYQEPQSILSQESEYKYRWFADGLLNMSYNCLDVHVLSGRGDQDALIYDSPVTNTQERYTYRQLLDHVSRFAGVLKGLGVQEGDRVVIYMPMIPQTIVAMLSCARIGAVHSVVWIRHWIW